VADLLIDRAARTVNFCGAPMKLTSGEFDLLWLLALHAGQELARSFLYEQLHSADWADFDRSIDLRVSAPAAETSGSLRRRTSSRPCVASAISTCGADMDRLFFRFQLKLLFSIVCAALIGTAFIVRA